MSPGRDGLVHPISKLTVPTSYTLCRKARERPNGKIAGHSREIMNLVFLSFLFLFLFFSVGHNVLYTTGQKKKDVGRPLPKLNIPPRHLPLHCVEVRVLCTSSPSFLTLPFFFAAAVPFRTVLDLQSIFHISPSSLTHRRFLLFFSTPGPLSSCSR